MKFTVTKRDIKLGILTKCSNTKCPVARAVRRVRSLRNVNIAVWDAYAGDGSSIRLSKKVVDAIKGMCEGKGMKPFSFTISEKQIKVLTAGSKVRAPHFGF